MKKYVFSLAFFFINILFCLSQNDINTFENRIKALTFEEINDSLIQNNYSGLEYEVYKSRLLSIVSKSETSIKQKVIIYRRLTEIEEIQFNMDKAFEYASLAKYYAEKGNDSRDILLSINLLGIVSVFKGDYNLAIEHYYKALELAEKASDHFMIIAIKGNISSLKMEGSNIDEAITELDEILDKITSNKVENTKVFLPYVYNNLCRAYTLKNQYEKATYYCNLTQKFVDDKQTGHFSEVEFLQNYANLEIHKQHYEKALVFLELSDNIMDEGRIIDRNPYGFLYKGKLFFYKKQYEKAIKELLKIEQVSKKQKLNYLGLQETNALLAKSYLKINKKDSAYYYFEKAIGTNEKNSKKKSEIISQIIHKQGLKQMENSIQELDSNNRRRSALMQIAILTLFVFVTLSIARVIIIKKQNNRKFNDLISQLSTQQQITISNIKKEPTIKEINRDVINVEISSKILKGLKELEKKQYFLNEDSNTFNTAKKLKTNVTYLSKVIRYNYQCDFSTYINNLRINHAVRRLNEDKTFRSYTIKAISKEVGYKSTNSFVKHFKKQTKLLPSYYIKKLNS